MLSGFELYPRWVPLKFLCQRVKRMYIERAINKYCPVAILRRYIEAANLDLSSHLPLFRPLM